MAQELTPYAAAAVSAGGVLVGVLLKSLIDIWTDARRRSYDDRVRFLADKRDAYAVHYVAADDVIQFLDGSSLDDLQSAQATIDRMRRSAAALYFLAPWSVLDTTIGQAGPATSATELRRQLDAFVTAARADLRVEPVSR